MLRRGYLLEHFRDFALAGVVPRNVCLGDDAAASAGIVDDDHPADLPVLHHLAAVGHARLWRDGRHGFRHDVGGLHPKRVLPLAARPRAPAPLRLPREHRPEATPAPRGPANRGASTRPCRERHRRRDDPGTPARVVSCLRNSWKSSCPRSAQFAPARICPASEICHCGGGQRRGLVIRSGQRVSGSMQSHQSCGGSVTKPISAAGAGGTVGRVFIPDRAVSSRVSPDGAATQIRGAPRTRRPCCAGVATTTSSQSRRARTA